MMIEQDVSSLMASSAVSFGLFGVSTLHLATRHDTESNHQSYLQVYIVASLRSQYGRRS
jgi:hypothetical protein